MKSIIFVFVTLCVFTHPHSAFAYSDLYVLLEGVLRCVGNNLEQIAFQDLCPIISTIGCSRASISQLDACVLANMNGATDAQIVTTLRSLVVYLNKYPSLITCIKNYVLSLCPNICSIPGVVLCTSTGINLNLLITYTQNGVVGNYC
ncbi:hypothetical protein FQR65_LT18235 [Abscondita terminalis]|nr:hypothetical protein FQR65_LT18235 [Abscondita terminalis]